MLEVDLLLEEPVKGLKNGRSEVRQFAGLGKISCILKYLLLTTLLLLKDLDQPDVFETNDLPEADQYDATDYEDNSDFVETLHITASEAFGKFKGKNIETEGVDFSDRIRRCDFVHVLIGGLADFFLPGVTSKVYVLGARDKVT